jgi:hypothetical protein
MIIKSGVFAASIFAMQPLWGGTYSAALNDPSNVFDAPIPGFIGPDGIGKPRLLAFDASDNPFFQNPNNYVNPLFFDWAATVTDYYRSDGGTAYSNSSDALGPVTGDYLDVVSLGDLGATEIAAGARPGSITLQLAKPIQNFAGADFVIFENGFVDGSLFAGELAYVEVSANGRDFVRFPSASLNTAVTGGYSSIDSSNVFNLAGKHANGNGVSWGTPFDLSQVNLAQISHIRLVDIPGNGAFKDSLQRSIYDAWLSFGSGGFDLEAVGGISTQMTFAEWPPLQVLAPAERGPLTNPDGDGLPNLLEYAFARLPAQNDGNEAAPKFQLVLDNGILRPELRFIRDQRLTDLTYSVQASSTLTSNGWSTIATSTAGGPLLAAPGQTLVISETSASAIASIGVIREVKVRDAGALAGKRFYRLAVTRNP